MKRLRRLLPRLADSTSGLAMTEFALAAPLLMTAGLWGTEVAWLALTNMRISQAAMHVADNASRIGDTSTLTQRKIYERDLNDVFVGAAIQAGTGIDVFEHGRVIVSSQETVPGDPANNQYIHWQRCMGKKAWASSYGKEGDGLGGGKPFKGMGPKGQEVEAFDDQDAVIFVEIAYDYQPLFSDMFVPDTAITAHAAFNVRDSRDLAKIYQRDDSNPDPVASCDKFEPLT
jgi:hypothetical protein